MSELFRVLEPGIAGMNPWCNPPTVESRAAEQAKIERWERERPDWCTCHLDKHCPHVLDSNLED